MADAEAQGGQFADDDEPTRSPSLATVIGVHVRAALATGVRVAIPASVTKVHTDAGGNVTQVDVAPGIHDFYRDETGALMVSPVPIVPNVAMTIPGAGGVRLTLPVQVGDLGHLSFFDRSIDRWLSGTGGAVDPEIYTRLNLTDAAFTPGLRPFGAPWQNWPSDHATLGTDGADDGSHVKIHFRPAFICCGDESGSDFVALAQAVLSELNKIKTAFDLHTHVVAGAMGGGPGITSAVPSGTFSPASVAATQAKAK